MIGRTLKHYVIEEVLGQGGMGTVYRARDTRLQRQVALKVLAPELTADPERRQRFVREARSAAAITHPSIAQVYDIDEADGVTFIAMELVEGTTVRRLIVDRDLDLLASLEIGIQVGEGLARAHETGIVHRDIKSENIMVTRDGHAKILDFGLAKLDPIRSSEAAPGQAPEEHISQMATLAQTQAGMVVGTVAYMSPEQARGKPVDYRSDIFSLGVTIYEMATGRLPFQGESPLDTMHAIAFEETRPITVLRQDVPPELQRIISRCLRKRAGDRYPDTRTLVADLKALKRDMESGVTRAISLGDRLRDRFSSWRRIELPTLAWILGGLGLLALVILLSTKRIQLGSFVLLVVVGLWLYRRIRNRVPRMMKRFATKVSRIAEVQLISVRQSHATVIVDRMQAKTYLRINSLKDGLNEKLLFGDPMTVSLRDDVPLEELRRMLQEPGVVYVRDDVFEKPAIRA